MKWRTKWRTPFFFKLCHITYERTTHYVPSSACEMMKERKHALHSLRSFHLSFFIHHILTAVLPYAWLIIKGEKNQRPNKTRKQQVSEINACASCLIWFFCSPLFPSCFHSHYLVRACVRFSLNPKSSTAWKPVGQVEPPVSRVVTEGCLSVGDEDETDLTDALQLWVWEPTISEGLG